MDGGIEFLDFAENIYYNDNKGNKCNKMGMVYIREVHKVHPPYVNRAN